jgi:chromosome segregation ATPase
LQNQLGNYQYNDSILAQNLEQLNHKLLDVYKQCEEFRENNAQLIASKQQVDKQLEEQKQQIQELELLINNSEERNQQEEINQLRTDLAMSSAQCLQLEEANNAWQQYQQTQLDHFRHILQEYLPLDENVSFDQAAQMIVDQMTKDRKDFNERYEALEKVSDGLRSGTIFFDLEVDY